MAFDATQLAPQNILGPDGEEPDPNTLPVGYVYKPRSVPSLYVVEYQSGPGSARVWSRIPGFSPFSVLVNPVFYVDPVSGNDSNAGTISAPFATVDHAIQELAPGWFGVAKIIPRAGTSTLGTSTVWPTPLGGSNATAGALLIDGIDSTDSGLGARTSAGGTTGSISAAPTFGTVVDSVGGLVVNAYRGQFIRFTSGATLNGRSFQVAANTANTFTVCGTLPVAPTTETFVVERPAAVFSWSGVQSMQAMGVVGFQNIQFTGPGGSNTLRISGGIWGLQRCRFASVGTGGIALRNNAQLTDLAALASYLGGLSIAQQCGSFFNGTPISMNLSLASGMSPAGATFTRNLFVDSNFQVFGPQNVQFTSSYFTGNSYLRFAYRSALLLAGNIHDTVTPAPAAPSVIVGAFGAAVVAAKGATLAISNSNISNTPASGTNGDAIFVEDGSNADVSTVAGSGNAGLGCRVARASVLRCNTANTVTGSGGDYKLGDNAVGLWGDFVSGSKITDLVQLCFGSHHT